MNFNEGTEDEASKVANIEEEADGSRDGWEDDKHQHNCVHLEKQS